ncbi:TPA: HU family DNA-binding protein [Pseudomonas putida]|uniref:HU family DNA-binding protein n=1 Tax=Pseudomonas TaxID=286 RepID=UPI00105212D1|nr:MULTISPECIES: HU family DNA-binding protein [Pseudomonas]MCS4064868.1 DNA-binding protein HU-beta [Pseudomonas putida]MDD1991179.1 HU family DNA-binding protein [Pseudomonas putida]TCP79873.1 DNA-binding protein HU-beta [Pseudomonas putida]HDS0918333.1 HU family DNA-binding protein [Pseudomonas putida]HDS0921574.1 HU family DNA-binding protein [Pseudomonas putida]
MNKSQLVADVAQRADLNKATAQKVVDAFIHAVKVSLSEGNEVALVGFGTFKTEQTKARAGRNPQTGKPMQIAAATKAKFVPGKSLKDTVNFSE